uniref:Uncharacterized protein n=1 Tax=Mus musculus TaxID=10090 RepID=Q8CBV6_MOUSE|nr:unnamed protein product [Mus musculus]
MTFISQGEIKYLGHSTGSKTHFSKFPLHYSANVNIMKGEARQKKKKKKPNKKNKGQVFVMGQWVLWRHMTMKVKRVPPLLIGIKMLYQEMGSIICFCLHIAVSPMSTHFPHHSFLFFPNFLKPSLPQCNLVCFHVS